jgi:hypothetical protein
MSNNTIQLTVYLAEARAGYASPVFAASSDEELLAKVAATCREAWKQRDWAVYWGEESKYDVPPAVPETDKEVVDTYFHEPDSDCDDGKTESVRFWREDVEFSEECLCALLRGRGYEVRKRALGSLAPPITLPGQELESSTPHSREGRKKAGSEDRERRVFHAAVAGSGCRSADDRRDPATDHYQHPEPTKRRWK